MQIAPPCPQLDELEETEIEPELPTEDFPELTAMVPLAPACPATAV
jgi:hypothetical protein